MKQREIWPDVLRIIASFSVVVIHVTSIGIEEFEKGSSVYTLSLMLNSISRWSVPAFFIISGMFILNPTYSFNINEFYTKKVGKIVRIIIIWGILYSLLDQYIYYKITWKSAIIAIYGVITGNTGYHLWFLYTLLLLYIASPILRTLTVYGTEDSLVYTIIIWFVFSIVIGWINSMAYEYIHIDNLLPFTAITITGYSGFYLLGGAMNRVKLRRVYSFLIPVAVFMLMVGSFIISQKLEIDISPWISPLGVLSCVLSIGVVDLLKNSDFSRISKDFKNFVHQLARRTLGIYLVHVFFVSFIFRILKNQLKLFSILPWCLAIFACSACITAILERIPPLNKILL